MGFGGGSSCFTACLADTFNGVVSWRLFGETLRAFAQRLLQRDFAGMNFNVLSLLVASCNPENPLKIQRLINSCSACNLTFLAIQNTLHPFALSAFVQKFTLCVNFSVFRYPYSVVCIYFALSALVQILAILRFCHSK